MPGVAIKQECVEQETSPGILPTEELEGSPGVERSVLDEPYSNLDEELNSQSVWPAGSRYKRERSRSSSIGQDGEQRGRKLNKKSKEEVSSAREVDRRPKDHLTEESAH